MRFHTFKAAAGLAAVTSLAVMSACSDVTSPSSNLRPTSLRAGVVIPTPAQVIVPGSPAGDWMSYNPDESGRATSEFWDNKSSDDRPFNTVSGLPDTGHGFCNIGAFAAGIIGPGTAGQDCFFQTPGSSANVPAQNVYTTFWGDKGLTAGAGNDASAFKFSGNYEYDLTLIAAYSSGVSEVGYFTDTYAFHALSAFSSKTLNTTVTIPAGADWGLYLKHSDPATGTVITDNGCAANTVCSDAAGSFDPANLPQHFAMFKNTAGTSYIIGVEDANMKLLPNATFEDSDFNDYIFRVTPRAIPSGGCTYTKGWYRNNGSNTVTPVNGLSKADAQAIFDATPGKPGNVTWVGSNDLLNLYQQLLAAMLNGGTSSGNSTVTGAIAAAQLGTTVTGLKITTTLTQAQISALINTLSTFNEGSFPGFPHCS